METNTQIPSFWTLQLIGWTGYTIDRFISLEGRFFPVAATYIAVAFGLTLLLRPIYHRVWKKTQSIIIIGLTAIFCSITAAFLWLVLGEIIFDFFGIREIKYERFADFLWDSFRYSLQHHKPFLFLSWSSLYFGIKYWQSKRTEEELALKANALAQETELKMLRYQINPHFLFNSLNSASALIRENPKRAEKMLDELSEFLRYSLNKTKAGLVTLNEEIEAVQNYLNIEKIRFEEKLVVDFQISESVLNFNLPNFLLHPLIENAVKYGMQTSDLPLKIRIRAEKLDETVLIEVINSGFWVENGNLNGNGTNVGIKNVRKRLEQFFPGRHEFGISKEPASVRITLKFYQ